MRAYPVDRFRFDEMVIGVIEVVPHVDYDTGHQKTNHSRVPLWNIRLNVRSGFKASRPEVIEVRIPSNKPIIEVSGYRPVFGNLMANLWDNPKTKTFGVNLTADEIKFKKP